MFRYENIMQACWDLDPDTRPDFDAIHPWLKQFFFSGGAANYYDEEQLLSDEEELYFDAASARN